MVRCLEFVEILQISLTFRDPLFFLFKPAENSSLLTRISNAGLVFGRERHAQMLSVAQVMLGNSPCSVLIPFQSAGELSQWACAGYRCWTFQKFGFSVPQQSWCKVEMPLNCVCVRWDSQLPAVPGILCRHVGVPSDAKWNANKRKGSTTSNNF